MLYFNSTKQTIIDAISKKVFWAFEISSGSGSGYSFSDEGGISFSDEGGISFDDSPGGDYYWSTVSRIWNGNTYEFKIIPESFNGITLNRNKSELGLHSPNVLEFDIINKNNTIGKNTFLNSVIVVKLVVSDYTNEEIIRQWQFVVKRIDPGRQILHFYCEDPIYKTLKGDYPNTQLVKNIFPASNSVLDDNVCIPEPYGTAYIPIRSVYDNDHNTYTSTTLSVIASSNGSRCKINDTSSGLDIFEIGRTVTISGFGTTNNNQSVLVLNKSSTKLAFAASAGFLAEAAGQDVTITQGSRTYLLGSTAYTFSLKKIRSPRDWGKKSEWSSTAYTFSQAIKTDPSTNSWRTFQPIIHDVNNDGTADAPGLWQQGENFLDVPTKFTRSDSSALTNPADVIKTVLGNLGVSSTKLKLDSNLIGYWSLDEGGGSTSAYDASTNSNNLQIFNTTFSTGEISNCLNFNSSEKWSKITNFSNVDSSQISISCWVYLTTQKNSHNIIHQEPSSTRWGLSASSGQISFNVYEDPASHTAYKNINYTNTWHHVVCTYNGSVAKIYVDTTMGVSSTAHSVTLNTTADLYVSSSGVNFVEGRVDEVRIYNAELSSSEVEELYYNPDMKGWWSHARNTYQQLGLEFNGAFWYKESREKKLATLLNMCHSVLHIEDKIELRPLIKESQYTVDDSIVLTSGSETDISTFRYNNLTSDDSDDCGYIAYQQSDESQDRFLQLLVGAKGDTKTKISNEILEIPFVQNSILVQKIGILYYQRKLLRQALLEFSAKFKVVGLQPDDVVTIDHSDYGGNYNALIESITIRKDLSIVLKCVNFTYALDDWDDLSPSTIIVYDDDPDAKVWEPAIAGPLSDQDIGKAALQLWARPYLVVGPNTNQGDYTDIQSAINALTETNHEGIYIKNGTYTLTSPIYLPDQDINIQGESVGGVKITPNENEDGIILHNLKSNYKISTLSFISQNTSSFSNMLKIYGDASTDNSSIVNLENIKFTLDNTSTGTSGDKAIYLENGSGEIFINNISVNNGEYAVYIDSCKKISCSYSILEKQRNYGIYIKSSTILEYVDGITINNNRILDFNKYGIYIYGTTNYLDSANIDISFNQIKLNSTNNLIGFRYFYGITAIKTDRIKIIGNTINMQSTSVFYSGGDEFVGGINGYLCDNGNFSNNIIDITIGCSSNYTGVFGIAGLKFNNCQINNNSIKIDSTSTGGGGGSVLSNVHGIYAGGSRNIIQGNHINLTNNRTEEIGIEFSTNSENNKGSDNITYNCGISIVSGSTTNGVTAKDI